MKLKWAFCLQVAPTEGWHFEPNEVAVNVDGSTDSCSLGIDINFILQGFAVTGQVSNRFSVLHLIALGTDGIAKPTVIFSFPQQALDSVD